MIQKEYGMRVAAMTLGAHGALARVDGRFVYSPAFVVNCVDTTGAGDVFHGAFCYAVLTGLPMREILDFSNAMAALELHGDRRSRRHQDPGPGRGPHAACRAASQRGYSTHSASQADVHDSASGYTAELFDAVRHARDHRRQCNGVSVPGVARSVRAELLHLSLRHRARPACNMRTSLRPCSCMAAGCT